ncbi:MAG: hypothetical protein D3917_11290 [Candidatus Electrothrix sp. AX5]|uniref:Uncharacterized protein n=1 Tax=Candidatus Electrothrix aarhusensis TaxID=1859131 RepID=A0A3S3UAF9_9BACT|nr:hypothetical protein [Candidatus Electrothrix sp. AX5]RWX47385.1 hypothetical protein H206_01002 [Candidatus Electrothrix aarhusensis]
MLCYLCGKEIESDKEISRDHAIPRLFIERSQPKVKGFDYAGTINTHISCNNNFGPEDYCRKAMKIISNLNNSNSVTFSPGKKNDLPLLYLNQKNFNDFSRNDLNYFKIIDARKKSYEEIKGYHFTEKDKPTIINDILFTALAVIAKSAAALLLKKEYLKKVPSCWRISSFPHAGETKNLSFDRILGKAKPFDKDVKVYIEYLGGEVYFVLFAAHSVMVYLFFHSADNDKNLKEISSKFPNEPHYYFEGTCINELITHQWKML